MGEGGCGCGGGLPAAALIHRVDAEDVQVFPALLWVQADEVLAVLVEVVDQIAIETVLCDYIDGTWWGREFREIVSLRHSYPDHYLILSMHTLYLTLFYLFIVLSM